MYQLIANILDTENHEGKPSKRENMLKPLISAKQKVVRKMKQRVGRANTLHTISIHRTAVSWHILHRELTVGSHPQV